MTCKLPERKAIRLQNFDYNSPGVYFITVCTREKRKILCDIVGTGLLDGPQIRLSEYGRTAKAQLEYMSDFYEDIKLDKYVIMPNHIHLLLRILPCGSGPSGRPVPTNSKLSSFVGTFKRFCDKQYGENIWQQRSYDHVIRDESDYLKIREYIDNNPAKWTEDRFYLP